MEEMGSERKILRKEIFKMKCPDRIMAGDPYYLETKPPERLKKLIVDYAPPHFYEGRLILTESYMAGFPDYKLNTVEIYMAPKETIEVYAGGLIYESQEMAQKPIGVDTAKYFIEVDGKREIFHTGGDGYWGDAYEYRHMENEKSYVDGLLVVMTMPDYMSYEMVKNTMNYLFEDMQSIQQGQTVKKSQKKADPDR